MSACRVGLETTKLFSPNIFARRPLPAPTRYTACVDNTLYRRPLPAGAIPFSSSEGRQVFAEALASGGLDGYFALAEQFHTQSDPAFCGLGSLVVALNALAIDPGRLWKGPWRWFAEDLLDCCVPLDEVRTRGLSLDELACLARCNGAEVELERGSPEPENLAAFRSALAHSVSAARVLIAAYDRAALDQTGSGHFSPIAGYHAARDLALVLDVARFKYPPHWVPVERLWRATHAIDAATGLARGWLLLRARARGVALGFSLRCEGEGWQALATRLRALLAELGQASDLSAIVQAVLPLAVHIELREPSAPTHKEALSNARAALRAAPIYGQVAQLLQPEQAELVVLLLHVVAGDLEPAQRAMLQISPANHDIALLSELENLRAQLSAVASLSPRSGGLAALP